MAICTTLYGQQIDQSNLYRGIDMLEKKQIVMKGFSLNGIKGVWSLEEAEISEGSFDSEYTMETDTVMAVEQGNRTFYNQDRAHKVSDTL